MGICMFAQSGGMDNLFGAMDHQAFYAARNFVAYGMKSIFRVKMRWRRRMR